MVLLRQGSAPVRAPGSLRLPRNRVLETAQSPSEGNVMAIPLRVLIVEDQPADAVLLVHELRRAGYDPTWRRVATEGEYRDALDPALDIVFADYNPPQFGAIRALHLLQEQGLDAPLILVSGTIGEDLAVECLKHGAADYLRKGRLARLGAAVEHALERKRLRVEKEQAERALRDATEKLRAFIQAAPFAIVTCDPEGNVTLWNPAAERLFGWRAGEVTGRPAPFVPEDRRKEFGALQGQVLRGEPVAGVEVRAQRSDGTPVDVRLSAAPLHDVAGRISATMTIVADITDRKQAEDQLRRQREALHQSERLAALGELLASVAHELNDPLSVIMVEAQLLCAALGQGPQAGRGARIAEAAEHCVRVVRNFLALARHRPMERERVDLNRIVRETIELMAYPLRVDGVQVTLDAAPDLPALWADPAQLHQVVLNLVCNAHQAMLQAMLRHLTISTRFDGSRRRISLAVADTGPGISPEIQSRIFEPFFTTRPEGQGTGLGLSLCRGVVEGHGGSISVESRPGEGAVFHVELPLEVPPAPPEGRAAAEAPPLIAGKTILVVDDEPMIAGVLVDILSADGHRVHTAENGAVALEKLRGQTYDLILIDIKMPELDGPALYREIQRRYPDLPRRIIFLTGDVQSREAAAFLERTGAPSLSKPFRLEELRRLTHEVLRTP